MAVTLQIAEVDAVVAGITYQLAEANARVGGMSYQLADASAVVGDTFTVTLGPVAPPTFSPFDTATLTASSVTPPDSWLFQRITGFGGTVMASPPNTIVLVGTGATRTYKCPGRLTTLSLFWRVTASKAGFPDAVAEIKHTVSPHAGWFDNNGIGWEWHL